MQRLMITITLNHIHQVVCILSAVAVLSSACQRDIDSEQGNESSSIDELAVPNPLFPDSLEGTWVRVFPYTGGRDTLTLYPAGRATGPRWEIRDAGALEDILRWTLKYDLFCVGDTKVLSCSGFELVGDTLSLADSDFTLLVRPNCVTYESLQQDSLHAHDRAWFGRVTPMPKPY